VNQHGEGFGEQHHVGTVRPTGPGRRRECRYQAGVLNLEEKPCPVGRILSRSEIWNSKIAMQKVA